MFSIQHFRLQESSKKTRMAEAVKSVKDVGYLWQSHVDIRNVNPFPARKKNISPGPTALHPRST